LWHFCGGFVAIFQQKGADAHILAPLWPRTAFGDGFALRQATRHGQNMEFVGGD
jgi:hypothetical protein